MAVDDTGSSARSQGFNDVVFGSIAGMVSKVFEHPFDLCKVRLQSQVLEASARFNGPIDCLYKTWKYEGVRGLYRGLPAPIVGAMAENATLFFAYNKLLSAVRSFDRGKTQYDLVPYTLPQVAIAAAGAGAITSYVLTPIELVKCKMQVQMLATETLPVASAGVGALLAHPPPALRPAFRDLPGPFAIIASTIRSQGLKGLWLGQTGTLIRETGGGAAWFTTKEFVSSLFLARRAKGGGAGGTNDPSSKQLQPWESAASGACAGVAYNVVLFPADSVKSAIQTEQELRPRKPGMPPMPKTTFSGTFKAIYKAQGLKGLYAGMGITVARAAPSSAIIFVIYDTLDKHFG